MSEEARAELEAREKRVGERIENTGWALFLIMLGLLWMLPDGSYPEGSWLLGSGVIILGVQLCRGLFGLPVSGVTLILGVLALGMGFGDMFSFDVPIVPALLVLLGLYLLFEQLLKRRG